MKFGAMLFQRRGEDLAANTKLAEELGFESVWMGEHLAFPFEFKSRYPGSPDGKPPVRPDIHLPDPLLVFAYLASITTKIRFGTGVYVLPLRNPFAVAKAVATLDQLSNGRFIFGVGVGWLKEEFEYVGMNWENRALRSNEYMKLLTALWSEERPTFKGKTVAAEGFYFNPKTVQQPHPPFIIGGHGEAAYKRAARLADGFYVTAQNMDDAAQTVARLREVERNYQRAKPLEITMGVGPVTVDTVKRLEEMGVERIMPGRELVSRDSLGALRSFHDRVLSKVR
jgi:probable F420-dependent oxidoreductase